MKDLLVRELERDSGKRKNKRIDDCNKGLITHFSTAWSQQRVLVMMVLLFRSLSCKSFITMAVMVSRKMEVCLQSGREKGLIT